MAVRGVHDHHVNLVIREDRDALFVMRGNCRADAQAVLSIAIEHRLNVLDQGPHVGEAVQADQFAVFHQRQFADLVLLHDVVGLLEGRAFRRRDDLRSHDLRNRRVRIPGKLDVGRRENTDESIAGIEDREAAECIPFILAHFMDGFQRVRRAESHRVFNQPIEVVFDCANDLRLLLRCKIAMDDADAAEHRHGDGHAGLGHGIHRGADKRNIDGNTR